MTVIHRLHRLRLLGLTALAATIIGCSDPASPSDRQPEGIEIVQGDAQEGAPGDELAVQLVVRVVDAGGNPVDGVFILWTGDGTTWVDVTDTAEDGITRNYWILGDQTGTQRMELWVYDVETHERGKFLGYLEAIAHPSG